MEQVKYSLLWYQNWLLQTTNCTLNGKYGLKVRNCTHFSKGPQHNFEVLVLIMVYVIFPFHETLFFVSTAFLGPIF